MDAIKHTVKEANRPEEGTPDVPAVPGPASKLSPEDMEKLATDNINLAYWFANRWGNIPGVSKEDIESQAIHGLVKAANTYNPQKGEFAAYAGQIIRNYLNHLHYHQGEKTSMEPVSLDAPLGDEGEGDDSSMHDKYSDPSAKGTETGTARAEATKIINDEIDKIAEPDRSMVKRWMNGESYRDMQKDFGLSFMQIRNRVSAAMTKLKFRLADQDILSLQDIWPESISTGLSGKTVLECILTQIEVTLAIKRLQEKNLRARLTA